MGPESKPRTLLLRRLLPGPDQWVYLRYLLKRTQLRLGIRGKRPEEKVDSGRFASLPARKRKGWPAVRLPLPGGTVFVLFEELRSFRVAMWMTAVSMSDLVPAYLNLFRESDNLLDVQGSRTTRRLIASVEGTEVELIIAEADGLRSISIVQQVR